MRSTCKYIVHKVLSKKIDEYSYIIKRYSNREYEEIVLQSDIKFYNLDYKIKNNVIIKYANCPQCNTPWTISGFGSSIWYDCKKCNKKAEDLVF